MLGQLSANPEQELLLNKEYHRIIELQASKEHPVQNPTKAGTQQQVAQKCV